MFYVFNRDGRFVAKSDLELNGDDLATRNEIAIKSDVDFINPILVGNKIIEKGLEPSKHHQWDGKAWVISPEKMTALLLEQRAQLISAIDDKATAIYSVWTRFEAEYKARKEAAETFKNGGYEGEPSVYITSFAVPAGLDNKTATDIILQQAAGLQKLQDHLAALRMRKYELKHPDLTLEQMQAIYDDITKQMSDLMEAYNNG